MVEKTPSLLKLDDEVYVALLIGFTAGHRTEDADIASAVFRGDSKNLVAVPSEEFVRLRQYCPPPLPRRPHPLLTGTSRLIMGLSEFPDTFKELLGPPDIGITRLSAASGPEGADGGSHDAFSDPEGPGARVKQNTRHESFSEPVP